MLDDLTRCDDGFRHDQAVTVIGHSADLKRGHRVCSSKAADVLPDALFDLRPYQFFAMFGAEDDVVEEGRVCVCHIGIGDRMTFYDDRFNRRYATGSFLNLPVG